MLIPLEKTIEPIDFREKIQRAIVYPPDPVLKHEKNKPNP